jgi:segregation and condensation protein B
MDKYMTEKQEIINEEQQEAEEPVARKTESDLSDMSDESDHSEVSDELHIASSDSIEEDSDTSEEERDTENTFDCDSIDNTEANDEPQETGNKSDESDVSDLSDRSEKTEESPVTGDEPQVISEEFKKPDGEVSLETVIEAVLFASDESLTPVRLAGITETTTKQVRDIVKNLNDKYEANNSAFRIEQIAGGYQMLTLSKYNYWLKKLLRARSETKLSPAAMETLAIIAYKQPVIRADIEAIRGVAVGEVIRSLSYKGLVKIVGRAEILGRPMLYGTTKKFLEVFGLNTLKDLPKIEELKRPPG